MRKFTRGTNLRQVNSPTRTVHQGHPGPEPSIGPIPVTYEPDRHPRRARGQSRRNFPPAELPEGVLCKMAAIEDFNKIVGTLGAAIIGCEGLDIEGSSGELYSQDFAGLHSREVPGTVKVRLVLPVVVCVHRAKTDT